MTEPSPGAGPQPAIPDALRLVLANFAVRVVPGSAPDDDGGFWQRSDAVLSWARRTLQDALHAGPDAAVAAAADVVDRLGDLPHTGGGDGPQVALAPPLVTLYHAPTATALLTAHPGPGPHVEQRDLHLTELLDQALGLLRDDADELARLPDVLLAMRCDACQDITEAGCSGEHAVDADGGPCFWVVCRGRRSPVLIMVTPTTLEPPAEATLRSD
jgi:hypothetical protein